jgi:hypothetical protein
LQIFQNLGRLVDPKFIEGIFQGFASNQAVPSYSKIGQQPSAIIKLSGIGGPSSQNGKD